ncbi:hypothetical protein ZEAMMB73_Zm00001d015021 [Zea mays]|uniref:Uncharacterized protein n=1 Tax=Zea mays TaxID=4577 RepID=A0A1D6GYS2_MAIZE|nr:hypothetical protein ZEAMMB73_Zm00001d015021 [Zea mays]
MVSVASETLRVLELVGCQALKQLCVDAPALESFALHCNVFVTNRDASYMPNLEELQLLMNYEGYCLEAVSGFFKLIPLPVLQRLFVRLHIDHKREGEGSSSAAVWSVENDDSEDMAPKEEIVLDQLTFVKFVNFSGTWCQLRLLSFFLDKSPVLHQLVLVTPEGEGALGDDRLKVIHERVAALEKASSEASITVCRPKEDDTPNHPHTSWRISRMRKGILTGAAAGVEEVDIQGLGMQERKNLIERLMRTAEEDNERFLLKLHDRMERVGIDNPTIEVRFENLDIDAEA